MAGTIPLQHKQERRLIAEELRRRSTGYGQSTAQFAVAFESKAGPIDRVALTRAFNVAVHKHAALRTIIVPTSRYDGTVRKMQLQTFARTGLYVPGLYEQCPLEHAEVELFERAWSGDSVELEAFAREECARFLDLGTAPALRAMVIAGKTRQLIILNLSHLVVDFWAVRLLHHEVAHSYESFLTGAPWQSTPARQQHDLVAEEIAMLQSPEGERHLEYWTEHYRALDDALIKASDLPFVSRTPGSPTFEVVRVPVSADDARQIHKASGGSPDYAFWRAMYGIALGILVNKTRVAFTANFLNRRRPGDQHVLAWCAHPHMMPVHAPWAAAWAEVWRQVRAGIREAQAHERYSWDSLSQRLGRLIGTTNTNLTFDVLPGNPVYRDASLQSVDVPGVAHCADLGVRIRHVDRNYTLVATFNSSRYDREGVSRLLTLLLDTIRACAAQPMANVGDIVRTVRYQQRKAGPAAVTG